MIYCKLVSSDNNSATYNFGIRTDNLSGSVIFHKDSNEPEVINLPEKGEEAMFWLRKLYVRHRDEFSKGIFKEKLSYECG